MNITMATNSNSQNRLRTWGLLYCATAFDPCDVSNFPEFDGTNGDTIQSQIEASYVFQRIAGFQSFVFDHTPENEQSLELDDCDLGEVSTNITFTPNATFDYFNVDDVDIFAKILGLDVQNVAGVLVPGATQLVVNPASYLQFIKIANQNCDGSAIVVNSVVGDVDWALVLGTDYDNIQDAQGNYGIQLISGWAITTLTQTFTIDYDYTPCAAKYTGYTVKSKSVPFSLLKFVTCPNEAGETNTYYGMKYNLTSNYAMTFDNLTRDGVSETPASLTLSAAKWARWLECKNTLTVVN